MDQAVEDRDTKISKDMLSRFKKTTSFTEGLDGGRQTDATDTSQFKLIHDRASIPKIQRLMCHYIDNHKVFFNKDVVRLPKYESSAPFFVSTMQFADAYLDN